MEDNAGGTGFKAEGELADADSRWSSTQGGRPSVNFSLSPGSLDVVMWS